MARSGFWAMKISSPHAVFFALHDGTMHTLEGPVTYRTGDAILTDSYGRKWPIMRDRFVSNYLPLEGTSHGEDGYYYKKPMKVFARRMPDEFTVKLTGGRGVLYGKAGDYLVRDPNGHEFIVDALAYEQTYKTL